MGRGSAQIRIKLRNVKRGGTVERSFQATEKWPRAILDTRPVQFLYQDGDDYHFMDRRRTISSTSPPISWARRPITSSRA